jgi:hypothetical protein
LSHLNVLMHIPIAFIHYSCLLKIVAVDDSFVIK